jgi:hypothetical protein
MDERRSVLAEDRDVRDLLDRHHDGSEIHGQLALSATCQPQSKRQSCT